MPKPDLTKVPIISQAVKKDVQSAREILDDVIQQAKELGLSEYPKPKSSPPSLADIDVSTMPNSELGQLYTQYTAHAQWVFGQVVQAEVGYKIGVANLKKIEAQLKTKLFAMEDVTKAEVPSLVKDDPVRTEHEFEVLKLFAMKEILDAHYKAYNKQAEALSRIISLRELDFEMTMRDNGIQGKRRMNGRPAGDFKRG
jgi:hypothetical protein